MNYSVLVVDDCETICKVISKILKDYEVDKVKKAMYQAEIAVKLGRV
jgi:CheY-like chemotaxis protein